MHNFNNQQSLLFGKKALFDAINNHLKIQYIIISKQSNLSSEELNKIKGYKIKYESNDFFNKYQNVNHQKVITILDQQIHFLSLDECIKKYNKQQRTTFLMLDENQDPRNFGSIIRSAVAFNTDAIIFKNNNQAQVNDLVIKTSIGAIYQIDLIKVSNLNQAIDRLKQNNYWIYSSSLANNSIDLNKIEFDNKSVIILGNENYGISNLTLKKSDFIFKINMQNKVQSLNISVAAGIILNKRFNQFN